MAIESATQTGATTTGSQVAQAKLTADYDSFLKLLTAQVSNQDPLEPMDSTTFVSQLAQLSQVEQAIVTNSNLESINARLAASGAMADMQLIGREVTLASDQVELIDGFGSFSYQLNDPASTVRARIVAEDGTVVRTFDGLAGTANGELHEVTWDGLDSEGLTVPDAVFTVEIEATDSEDMAVSASTYAITQVEELSFETGTPLLLLRNGMQTGSGQIIAVR